MGVEYVYGGVKSTQLKKTVSVNTLTSTNAYVAGFTSRLDQFDKLTIILVENNVNAIKYRIRVGVNSTDLKSLMTDQVCAKNAIEYETLSDLWNYIEIAIASNVAGTHSTDVDIHMIARRMT